MKPILIKTLINTDAGIVINNKDTNKIVKEWHVHEEYELLYVGKGETQVLIGDIEKTLVAGDLVLIGAGLPHILGENDSIEVTTLHFNRKQVLAQLHAISDLSSLDQMLDKALLGIEFKSTNESIGKLLSDLSTSTGVDKVINLFQLFKALLVDREKEILCSEGFSLFEPKIGLYVEDRLSNVVTYIKENLSKKITLDDLAEVANMSAPAFCNFFKRKTGKTVFQHLNEVRIGYAKRLMIESTLTVSEIAFECGYPSITFFNRQFKKSTNKPPTAYRKSFANMAA